MASSKMKITLDADGVRQLLRGFPIQGEMQRIGGRIAARAGEGVEVETFVGGSRARVTVRTATDEAKINEATLRTLTRAVGG